MRKSAVLIALLLLATGVFGEVVGWRGDGTGRYPDATPPVEWGKWPKSPVHDMLTAVNRPAGAEPGEDARPLEHFLVKEWLMIGPYPSAGEDPLEQAYLPDEADLQPSADEKIGELTWKPLVVKKRESDPLQGTELDWIYLGDLAGRKQENFVYAHAYLFSKTDGMVVFVADHAGALKVRVNGNVVYANPKGRLSIWAMNNISWGLGNYYPTPFGVTASRVSVPLRKGWNRVLLKGSGNVHLRLTAEGDAEYETKNILWETRLGDNSNASPIVVGDRIFVMADPDELVCIRKSDGKLLWRRSNSFFDATSAQDRAKSPAYKNVAELMDKRLAARTFAEKIVLQKQVHDALVAIDKDRYTMSIEGHPTSHRPVAGWTTPTAASDGKYVYVWVTNGVAACYDLQGNRRWITRVDLILRDPKEKYGPYQYPCSPVLIGGKFVVGIVYHGMVGLNASDGSLAWKNKDVGSSMICMNSGVVGGTEVVLGSAGEVIRVSDGKVLWSHKWNSSAGPAVFDKPILYLQYLGYVAIDFSGCKVDAFTAAVTPFECPGLTTFGAPLVHDGLLYFVDREGRLVVLDTNTRKTVYRRDLDVKPMLHYNAAGMCSSPTLGGGNVYLMDNQGTCLVLAPGREYKPLARNRIETLLERDYPVNPQEVFYSSPVFEGGRMYLRGEANLYCIGK